MSSALFVSEHVHASIEEEEANKKVEESKQTDPAGSREEHEEE